MFFVNAVKAGYSIAHSELTKYGKPKSQSGSNIENVEANFGKIIFTLLDYLVPYRYSISPPEYVDNILFFSLGYCAANFLALLNLLKGKV